MSTWAVARGLTRRIHVSSQWSEVAEAAPAAAIVANAARDHERTIDLALSARIPVLVEKPVALTLAACERVVSSALSQKVPLAAAQVFLYARYIDNFSKLVSTAGDIRFLRVLWMDPQTEDRYGEQKTFDAGLPVYADWLPHILPILRTLVPGGSVRCDTLELSRGGAHVKIKLELGSTPCEVELVRNGTQRQRLIEVSTDQKMARLDFSKEPGLITSDSTTIEGDPEWETNQRPVARMLTAFLRLAAGGHNDKRLSVESGLEACRIIEETRRFYQAAQVPGLAAGLDSGGPLDADHRYALGEVLQYDGPMPTTTLDRCIERLRRRCGSEGEGWLRVLKKADDPGKSLRTLAVAQ